MYKITIQLLMILVLIISCGGAKKEKPTKPQTPQFEATIKMVEPMTVIAIEKKGSYNEVGKAFSDLISWAMTKQAKITGAPFGIYYDDPAKVMSESTQYEICLPVASETKGDKVVKVKQLPAMEVISTIYVGPYDKIGNTYGKLTNWIQENNYLIIDAPREISPNDPSSVPPESLRTEIQIPVRKKVQ